MALFIEIGCLELEKILSYCLITGLVKQSANILLDTYIHSRKCIHELFNP